MQDLEAACDKSSFIPAETGYWLAECPSVPGCFSQGKMREETIQNIREAIEGYQIAFQQNLSSATRNSD